MFSAVSLLICGHRNQLVAVSCYGVWLQYVVDIFSLSLSLYSDFFPTHINSVFSPRLLLFCKKKNNKNKAVTRFSSLVGRSSSPSSILPPPIWHCGRRIRRRGEKRNVPARMTRSKPDQRRWSFCESVTAGVREYVKEGKKRGREGGRRCSWMGRRMTGGGFTLQVMCGFKIQLFFIYINLYLSCISSVSCSCTDSLSVTEGRQMKEDGGQRRAECERLIYQTNTKSFLPFSTYSQCLNNLCSRRLNSQNLLCLC